MPLKSERLSEPREGDRVRVTFEGEVERVFPGHSVQILRDSFTIFSLDEVEVLEPPVETFGPGDTVRSRSGGPFMFTIGHGGYFDWLNNVWNRRHFAFKSDDYERVRLEEAPF